MITLLAIGTDINVLFFGLIGLAAGIVSGFVGVGGGYMVTPALVVLGFPGYAAAGTDIAHITGKSVVAAIRHRQLGIVGLFVFGIMANRGRHVPHWMDAFLVKLDQAQDY